jgi:hypothetical protein
MRGESEILLKIGGRPTSDTRETRGTVDYVDMFPKGTLYETAGIAPDGRYEIN